VKTIRRLELDKTKKIAVYIRVSTEEQALNPEGSIRNQEDRLKEYVKRKNEVFHFGEIVETFIDRGLSGKNTNRPALQRLLQLILDDEINVVMVTELSRISRNLKDFNEIWELFKEKKCSFISLRESFDTSNAAGEMLLLNLANFAQFEHKQVSERVAANVLARSKRGLYNGGTVPLGYKLNPEKKGYLLVDTETSETIKVCFEAFLKEESLSTAAKWLNANGLKIKRAKQGGGKWTRLDYFTVDNLHHILRNKAYAGLKTFKEQEKEFETKAVWDAIVERDQFDRVQEILTKNRYRKKPSSQSRYPYLLSGLVQCEICKGVMCGKSAHGRNGKVGYYEHSWSTKKNSTLASKLLKHDPHRVSAKKLEPAVLGEVKKFLEDETYLARLFKITQARAKGDKQRSLRNRLSSDIASYKSQIDVLTERLSELPTTVSALPFYKRMETLQKKIEGAEIELNEEKQRNVSHENVIELETFKSFKLGFIEIFNQTSDLDLKAKLIRRLIHRVDVNVESITIHFYMGEKHYKRESAFAGPSSLINLGEKNLPRRKVLVRIL